jgi:hypothetical protein
VLREFAPTGLQDSAQGFNPGNRPPRATRPEGAADRRYLQLGVKSNCGTSLLRNDRLGIHLLAFSPFSFRANRLFSRFPGLKPHKRKFNARRYDGRMAFVPEGQDDSSQARSVWIEMQRGPVSEGRSSHCQSHRYLSSKPEPMPLQKRQVFLLKGILASNLSRDPLTVPLGRANSS